MIELVLQQEPYGCGVACVAMLLRIPYADARELMLARMMYNPEAGTKDEALERSLWEWDFSILRKYRQGGTKYDVAKPFAPMHLLFGVIRGASNAHFWLMDQTGKFLDPVLGPHDNIEAYEDIWNTAGLWRLQDLQNGVYGSGRLSD